MSGWGAHADVSDATVLTGMLLRVAAGFLLSIFVAFVALLLLRRKLRSGGLLSLPANGASDDGRINILESRRLGQQSEIFRVRSGRREYLIAASPGALLLLRESEHATAPEDPEP